MDFNKFLIFRSISRNDVGLFFRFRQHRSRHDLYMDLRTGVSALENKCSERKWQTHFEFRVSAKPHENLRVKNIVRNFFKDFQLKRSDSRRKITRSST